MSWHYQIRRRKFCDKWMYDVVEVYDRPYVPYRSKEPKVWTENSMYPGGGSRKEVIKDLENMLKDAKKYRTLTDKE